MTLIISPGKIYTDGIISSLQMTENDFSIQYLSITNSVVENSDIVTNAVLYVSDNIVIYSFPPKDSVLFLQHFKNNININVDRVVHIGVCGSITPELNQGDILEISRAYTILDSSKFYDLTTRNFFNLKCNAITYDRFALKEDKLQLFNTINPNINNPWIVDMGIYHAVQTFPTIESYKIVGDTLYQDVYDYRSNLQNIIDSKMSELINTISII